jgi:hypothetical protein
MCAITSAETVATLAVMNGQQQNLLSPHFNYTPAVSQKFKNFAIDDSPELRATAATPQAGSRATSKLRGVDQFIGSAVAVEVVRLNGNGRAGKYTFLEIAAIPGGILQNLLGRGAWACS